MKRIISAAVAFAAIISLLFSMPTLATGESTCTHTYEARLLSADCSHLERTEYCCSLCGDTYTVNTVDISDPQDFALVLRTSESEGKVTLTGTLYNNPGLIGARVVIYFDPTVLSYSSFTNGEIFTEKQYVMGVTPQSEHVTLYTECDVKSPAANNGTYFTITFDLIGQGDYGIYAANRPKDINGWDAETETTLFPVLNFINLQGKEKYGDHLFGAFETEVEPTFDVEGLSVSTCSVCGERKEESIPTLQHWIVGDLNNDSKVNAVDVNRLTQIIVCGCNDVYVNDAADINRDGHVNAVDGNMICRIVVGG